MRQKGKCTVCGKRFNAYGLGDTICPECECKEQEAAYTAEAASTVKVQAQNVAPAEPKQERHKAKSENLMRKDREKLERYLSRAYEVKQRNDRSEEVYASKECRCCRKKFTITVGEAEFFKSRNFPLPNSCKPCRAKRKQRKAEK